MIRFVVLAIISLLAVTPVVAQTPAISGGAVFPANNVWNTPIDNLPVNANSTAYVKTVGLNSPVHPDFGSAGGIPFTLVSGSQPKVKVAFRYAANSDSGPYPIPVNPLIESGSDHHILLIDTTNCIDYELFGAGKNADGSWSAGSGAIFPLTSNQLRPAGWTSADAAGLAMLPGLIRYDEVAAGSVNHAIRFSAPSTADTYVWPARHEASLHSGTQYPPMGTRFRLKADFDVSSYPAPDQVILNAMKKYGIILADNGAPWFIGGVPDSRWSDDVLHELTIVMGSNMEAVDDSALMINVNSAQAHQPGSTPGVLTNQWVSLVSQNSGKCLASTGSAISAGMDQQTCSGAAAQRFMLTPVNGGYEIAVQSSAMQLEVGGGPGATKDGTAVVQYPYGGATNQIWTVAPASTSSYYTFHPLSSGKCLDVSGISVYDGAEVWQWSCWGGENQSWQFKP